MCLQIHRSVPPMQPLTETPTRTVTSLLKCRVRYTPQPYGETTMQDFVISIMGIDPKTQKVFDACLPVRYNDITEQAAKRRATKRAADFGLIPVDKRWKNREGRKQIYRKTYKDQIGYSRYVIVSRSAKLLRD